MIKRITVESELVGMLTENTGRHFLDSGGAYGRNWERNKAKTLKDFKNEPPVTFHPLKFNEDSEPIPSTEIEYTV